MNEQGLYPDGDPVEPAKHCWCGVDNPYFADERDGLQERCGGSGILHCYCGGDFCVCHNHGEVECFGCPDCEDKDLDDDDYDVVVIDGEPYHCDEDDDDGD